MLTKPASSVEQIWGSYVDPGKKKRRTRTECSDRVQNGWRVFIKAVSLRHVGLPQMANQQTYCGPPKDHGHLLGPMTLT